MIEDALPEAQKQLAAAALSTSVPMHVVIHETLDEFLAVTGQDIGELRAWTTFDTVHFAPLASWRNSDHEHVVTRLTHELCHASIYQAFGSEKAAAAARIPTAFAEGACSVVAGQGAERPALDVVVKHAPANPFTPEFFAVDPGLAYAAAHHAMAWASRNAPTLFADVVEAAAKHPGPGCIERAFAQRTGMDLDALWPIFVDTLGTKT